MSEGLFPQHPRTGDWETLEGRMLAPHELPYDVQDSNFGPERLNQEVSTGLGSWDKHTIVNTGITGGGGTLAK